MLIEEIIQHALDEKASDIHVREDDCDWIRINGSLEPGEAQITAIDMDEFVNKYVKGKDGEVRTDFAFTFANRRFRGNYYLARGKRGLAIRVLSDKIPTMKQLNLPKEVAGLGELENGIVLVVGETGSGKSTTIASLLQDINLNESYFMLTVEDPVEYIYTAGKCRIAQREVGEDVVSFAQAVKDAMREDPDIIVLGEMRDRETIQNAITLAETGHLVFATLHARNCVEVLDRITDVFPGDEKEQMRSQTCNVLQAVIHQVLLPVPEYGRLPLLEIMRVDHTIRATLSNKDVKLESVRQLLRTNRKEGCLHRVDCFQFLMDNFGVDMDLAEKYLAKSDYELLIGMGR
jgi:twitching motility protein PilT